MDRPIAALAASFAVFAIGACGGGDTDPADPPVARAYGEVLRWSDLRHVVPLEAGAEDSTAMAQRFINNWLRQQVVLNKAEQNLDPSRTDFEAQLRDYRNSLVIFAYEQALVEQKLDTLVRDAEIEEHYALNGANFELDEDIVRVRWSKVREEDRRTLKRLEDHFLSGKDERMSELEVWLAQRGVPITDRSRVWTTVPELAAELPLPIHGTNAHVVREGRTVLREGTMAWFVDILEHRSKGSVSPIELVAQDIRSIIINQRKLRLVERMREDIYREAIERKDIEVL